MTTTFDNPGPSLAWISTSRNGFRISIRSPQVSVDYERRTPGDAAKFAILLRDEGDWHLRFRQSAQAVRLLVEEIDGAEA